MDYLHVYNNNQAHVPRTPPGRQYLSPVLPPIILALDQQHSLTFGYSSPRCLPTPILPSMSTNTPVHWSQQVVTIPVAVRNHAGMMPIITPMTSPRPQFEATGSLTPFGPGRHKAARFETATVACAQHSRGQSFTSYPAQNCDREWRRP